MITGHLGHVLCHPGILIAVTYVEPEVSFIGQHSFDLAKHRSQPLEIVLTWTVVAICAVVNAQVVGRRSHADVDTGFGQGLHACDAVLQYDMIFIQTVVLVLVWVSCPQDSFLPIRFHV